jgi:hypothetical protein
VGEFIDVTRELGCTPHVAQNLKRSGGSAVAVLTGMAVVRLRPLDGEWDVCWHKLTGSRRTTPSPRAALPTHTFLDTPAE